LQGFTAAQLSTESVSKLLSEEPSAQAGADLEYQLLEAAKAGKKIYLFFKKFGKFFEKFGRFFLQKFKKLIFKSHQHKQELILSSNYLKLPKLVRKF
jgi:hypothetical protein